MLIRCSESKTRPSQFEGKHALVFGRDEHGRTGMWIVCGACERRDFATFKPQINPIAVTQRWTRLGWAVVRDGEKATCPKCQESKNMRKHSEEATGKHGDDAKVIQHPAHSIARPPTTPPSAPRPVTPPVSATSQPEPSPALDAGGRPSPEAARALRDMYDLLDAHFQVETGLYTEGWSDEAIAGKTRLDVGTVAFYRDAAFGPTVNPRVRELEALISGLEDRFREEMAASAGLETRVREDAARLAAEAVRLSEEAAAIKTMRENLADDMRGRIDVLRHEVARLARWEAEQRREGR
ncbi:hypothetical protein [Nannocystis bainbridge]|uniref:Uncharacterized protein n=1 Tax=Nannocystis bainbridge TaxID=2995303 RepID=A0ABT5E798_9BACT|nr:hypothetical protein [Nannocystis bainbridge]MDC0720692.1 hypothetical protein [Nannocystis bainbridge]